MKLSINYLSIHLSEHASFLYTNMYILLIQIIEREDFFTEPHVEVFIPPDGEWIPVSDQKPLSYIELCVVD